LASAAIRAAAAILALASAAQAMSSWAAPDCRPTSAVRQPCFSVRGRLSVWNGAPTFRLQPTGSKRMLGVAGGDGDPASPSVLSPALRAAMTPPSPGELSPVTGVFRVCPLAPDRPGRMRPVCIATASRIAPATDAGRR
jgi:hypothetical protein